MKYWSDVTKQVYDTERACYEAEKKHADELAAKEANEKKLANERATRAKEVENAYKAAVEAKKAYDKLLREFLHDYGSFHATFKDIDPFFGIFDWF